MCERKHIDILLVTFPSFVIYFSLRALCTFQLKKDVSQFAELPFPNNSETKIFCKSFTISLFRFPCSSFILPSFYFFSSDVVSHCLIHESLPSHSLQVGT